MPTYEFECGDCGERFDVRASFSEWDEGLRPKCPRCGSENVGQVFVSVALLTRSGEVRFNPGAGGCSCGGACPR